MKKFFVFVAVCLLSFEAMAQSKPSITGTVTDSAARPLQYATVELFKDAASLQPLKAVFTTDKGRWAIANIDTGTYTLIISHTGFAEKRQAVTVSGTSIEVPAVALSSARGALQGVTVTARKPLVEQQDDKVIFNVEADPATKTETAIDVLRKTPFVGVDGDGNVTVNGQSNFKVLLNGRETGMFSQNPKEALKGFPGALITKIEVITSPSAKYDAEGVGGVINIITKKKVVGYNGSVNVYWSHTGWTNLNTNFSAKWGKLGATAYYGINGVSNFPGSSRMQTQPLVPAAFTNRLLLGTRRMTNLWQYGNAELSYEVDSLNTLALYGNINGGRNTNRLNQSITTSFASGEDSVSLYDAETRFEFPTKSVGADYIKKFAGNKDREFSLRVNGEFGNANTFLNSMLDNPTGTDRYVISNSVAKNRQYTIQTDYVLPLKPGQKLESGVKAIFRRAASDFQGFIRTNTAEDYKLNPFNTDGFRYDQDVWGAYTSYNIKVKKTTFRLGARVEHTIVDGSFLSSETEVKQEYTNLLPNIQASIKLSNAFTAVVTYSDRIQRPFIQALNPFRNDADPRYISFGNPNLEPQTIHSLAVQTRLSKGSTFAGITFTGSYSNDMIVQYASFDAATGITTTTSANVGKEQAISANGNFNTKLNKDWNLFINGNVRYNRIENKLMAGQANSGISGNANMNTTYSINKRFTASGYAGFFQAPVTIQSRYPLNLWYGLNAGYKFFNEKLTLSAGIANFLEKDRDFRTTTVDPSFLYTSVSTMPFRAASVSINWNFGKLTESVSKKKGVTNDDQLSGGQGSN